MGNIYLSCYDAVCRKLKLLQIAALVKGTCKVGTFFCHLQVDRPCRLFLIHRLMLLKCPIQAYSIAEICRYRIKICVAEGVLYQHCLRKIHHFRCQGNGLPLIAPHKAVKHPFTVAVGCGCFHNAYMVFRIKNLRCPAAAGKSIEISFPLSVFLKYVPKAVVFTLYAIFDSSIINCWNIISYNS